MKVIINNKQTRPDASQKMLSATPTIGKSIMMAGFAFVFAVGLLVLVIGWILDGVAFGAREWVFTLAMLALLVGGVLLSRQIPRSINLYRNGERVDGHVVGSWREVDDDNDSHYYLAFAVGDLTFKQQVNHKRYVAYEPGDNVQVIQLSEQPEVARINFS